MTEQARPARILGTWAGISRDVAQEFLDTQLTPALREEWEAELLSDEAVKRAADFAAACWDEDTPDTRQGIARGTLEAALAAAKEKRRWLRRS
jgi:hypothetical protein